MTSAICQFHLCIGLVFCHQISTGIYTAYGLCS